MTEILLISFADVFQTLLSVFSIFISEIWVCIDNALRGQYGLWNGFLMAVGGFYMLYKLSPIRRLVTANNIVGYFY
jgi:hypothetical protein